MTTPKFLLTPLHARPGSTVVARSVAEAAAMGKALEPLLPKGRRLAWKAHGYWTTKADMPRSCYGEGVSLTGRIYGTVRDRDFKSIEVRPDYSMGQDQGYLEAGLHPDDLAWVV